MSVLAHYESFLVNNVSTISTVESTLRSITWILPGRFKDAELASESCKYSIKLYIYMGSDPEFSPVSALLNVISLYHDTLLARIATTNPKYKSVLPASSHTRYTRAWSEKDARYKWAARTLQVIKFVELLVEMGLRRSVSNKARWRGVVFIESIKYAPHTFVLMVFCTHNCMQSHSSPTYFAHYPPTSTHLSCTRT
jgi:peroxin-16